MKKDDFTICKFPKEMNEYYTQAQEFCTKYGVVISYRYEGYRKYFADDKEERDVYLIRIERGKERMEFTFGTSLVDTRNGIKPNPYDILCCIEKSDPIDFENFCSEYGYDEDSRKAYSTYEAVVKQWKQVEGMFGDCLEELQEIN